VPPREEAVDDDVLLRATQVVYESGDRRLDEHELGLLEQSRGKGRFRR